MESLSSVFIPDAVGCLPCDEDANQPPANNAGVYVPTLVSVNPAPQPAVLGAAKKISGSSSLPMLLPAQTRPTGLLLPVSMTLRSNPPSQVDSIPKQSENLDYITPKRPSSLTPSLAATVVPLALSTSNSNSFRDVASAIVNFPVELVDTQREVVKSLDLVAASVKGLFSLHFIILGDAITLSTRSSSKGLVFLGFLELAQVDVNAVPLQLVESTLTVEGKAIPLGKYKSWLRIRHQQSNEYFVSCGSESDVADLHALLANLISKASNMSYSVLNASPKPPACAGHTLTKVDGKFYLIGGSVRISSEMWVLDTKTAVWTRVLIPGLPVLFKHVAVNIGGLIYVFGGSFNSQPQNRLYCIDPARQICTELNSAGRPGARWQHSAVELSGKMIIFGGLGQNCVFFNDLWSFDPVGGVWSELRVPNGPCARAGAVMVAVQKTILLWGGHGTADFPPDIHILHLDTATWKVEAGCGVIPTRRHSAAAAKVDNVVVLYGGELTPSGDILGDFFALGLKKFRWRRCANPAPFPLRSDAASAVLVNSTTQKPVFISFGGRADPRDPKQATDDCICIPLGKPLDLVDSWQPTQLDMNKKLNSYNFGTSRCRVTPVEAKGASKKTLRASLPPSPKPEQMAQKRTSPPGTRSSSPSAKDSKARPIVVQPHPADAAVKHNSSPMLPPSSRRELEKSNAPAASSTQKVVAPGPPVASANPIPSPSSLGPLKPVLNPTPDRSQSTPRIPSTPSNILIANARPTTPPAAIASAPTLASESKPLGPVGTPTSPLKLPVVAPTLGPRLPSIPANIPVVHARPATPPNGITPAASVSLEPKPSGSLASPAPQKYGPPVKVQVNQLPVAPVMARSDSPSRPTRPASVSSPTGTPSLQMHVRGNIERDTKEIRSPYASICTITSTHISFADREFSILEHAAILVDRSSVSLMEIGSTFPQRRAASFRLKPNAANEAFFKLYCSLRRKLMQNVVENGGSITITSSGTSSRPLVLNKARLFIWDTSTMQKREVKHKHVRAIFVCEGRVGLNLPSKAGGFLVCDCDDSLFIASLLRDFYKLKLIPVAPDTPKASPQQASVVPKPVSASATHEETYQDHSHSVLNSRVRQYYEDIKARHDKKNAASRVVNSNVASKSAIGSSRTLTAISSRDITIIHQLGRGSGGVIVSMAQWRQKFVAVKTVSAVTTEDMQALYDEAALNTQIPMHKNVLRTFGLVCEGQQYSLVMELAPKGSLLSALDTNRAQNRCFNFFSQLKLLRGILSGMSVISKSGIVHRDLAARNILLGQSLEPKIADFGFSRNIGSQKEGQTQSDLGPIRWMSPESLLGRKFSAKSDVWSFGILAIEIMSNGQLPYHWESDLISVALGIREGRLSPLAKMSPSWPKYIVELITPCVGMDSAQRPTFDQLIERIDRDFDGAFDDNEDDNEGKEESESEYLVGVGSEEIKPSVQLVSDKGNQVWQKPVRLANVNEIKQIKQLGMGEYGAVHLANWRGELVALKRIRDDTSSFALAAFKSEALLMSNMTFHRNVIKTKAYCLEPGQMCLVTELASNGSLDTLLEKISGGLEPPMDPMMIYYIALSVAEGMAFLHSQNIIHRDLAARNILLQEDWTPKVSDFGFARLVESESSARTSSDLGPIRWMAPENFGRTYSTKSDVWSWACLLLELFTKDKPYSNYELLHVGSLVREGKLSPMMWLKESKLALPTWAIEAIAACSEFNPDKRPTFSMIASNLAARFTEVEILSKSQYVDSVVNDFLL